MSIPLALGTLSFLLAVIWGAPLIRWLREHRVVGLRAADVADVVVAVGDLGRMIGQAAREAGHPSTFFAKDNAEAAAVIESIAQPGDVVLVKGSRGAHMEDIVSALAAGESEGAGR